MNNERKSFFSVFLVKLDLIKITKIAKRIRNNTINLTTLAKIEGQ